MHIMTRRSNTNLIRASALYGLLMLAAATVFAEPTPAAVAAFNAYVQKVESRLARQHSATPGFLAGQVTEPATNARLRSGELVIEKLTPETGADIPGAMLHDWRGTAFAPGATVADFERVMKDFPAYPQMFAPQVLQARILGHANGQIQATMRLRQKHVLTVVMDTYYDLGFERLDARHGFSNARGTQVNEISAPGTAKERALGPGEEHGFLWRLNTYWSYEERDGGLYMQIESISLTRSIPAGLGWAIGPFVESVPRESLEFTLRSMGNAVHKQERR